MFQVRKNKTLPLLHTCLLLPRKTQMHRIAIKMQTYMLPPFDVSKDPEGEKYEEAELKKILKLYRFSRFQAIDDAEVGLRGSHCSESHTSSEIWVLCGPARKAIAVLSEDTAIARTVAQTGYVFW